MPLLTHYVHSGSDPIRHDPLSRLYKVDNLFLGAKARLGRDRKEGLQRRAAPSDQRPAVSVRVSSSAVIHFQEGGYDPANLAAFAE